MVRSGTTPDVRASARRYGSLPRLAALTVEMGWAVRRSYQGRSRQWSGSRSYGAAGWLFHETGGEWIDVAEKPESKGARLAGGGAAGFRCAEPAGVPWGGDAELGEGVTVDPARQRLAAAGGERGAEEPLPGVADPPPPPLVAELVVGGVEVETEPVFGPVHDPVPLTAGWL